MRRTTVPKIEIISVSALHLTALEKNLHDLSWWAKSKALCARPRYRLDQAYTIKCRIDGVLTIIVIPAGFETDFASVPRLAWLVPGFSPGGVLCPGAVPHDFGYQYGYYLRRAPQGMSGTFGDKWPGLTLMSANINQAWCDELLRAVSEHVTGAQIVPKIAQWVLSKFGKLAWGKYRSRGPSAYGPGTNSLDLPGITPEGMKL